MSGRGSGGLGTRVHRLLLRLLPAEFRLRHGAAMEEAFGAAWADAAGAGAGAALRLLLREGWDLARTAVSLRWPAPPTPAVAAVTPIHATVPGSAGVAATLMDDFRLAVRATLRRRGFLSLAALTLALGVGSATAMYSALKSVVLDPLPFPGAERMVTLWRAFGDDGSDARLALQPADIEALREGSRVFDGLESYAPASLTLTGLGDPVRVQAMRITPGVLALMGVTPRHGRGFTAEEAAGAGERVTLLSHAFWRSRFGGRPDVLGETLQLNGEAWTIIGVMPPHARRPDGSPMGLDVWLPLGDAERFRFTVAGLAEGVSVAAAAAQVDAVVRGGSAGPFTGVARPLVQTGPLHDHLRILMVAVMLLLLVACVNVSNLLIQRAAARRTETAVRAAIGATRPRLFRQFAFESLILAGAGALLGAAVAHGALRALLALRPDQLEALRHVEIDGGVLLFCVVVSAAAGVAFGLLPAVRGSRADATGVLGRAGRGVFGAPARLRWSLVGAEVALSFALLVGAMLAITSLREIGGRDPGFRADGLVAVDVGLPSWRHGTSDAALAAFEEITAAVRRVPRVESASLVTSVPPRAAIGRFGHLEAEGHSRETEPTAIHVVEGDVHHLATLGATLLAGRRFTQEDVGVEPTPVILTESAAARIFGSGVALGRRFRIEGPPDHTVVGIVRDIRPTGLGEEAAAPLLFLPLQRGGTQRTIAVRASGADAHLLLDLRQAVRGAEPDAVVDVATTRELLAATIARERFTTALLSTFAALALLLAGVGLYGVLSQGVVARTREIGVRVALGADARRIGSMILRQGLAATGAGLVAGGGLAAMGLALLRSEVFGLAENQPAAWAAAALMLVAVATAAMIVPAVRAARTDPMRAMGAE